MIKRYNQFVSGVKTNEEFIMPTKSDNYSDDMKSEMEPEMSQMPKMEEEEVAVDKYTLALQELSDLANEMGLNVEYSPEFSRVVNIQNSSGVLKITTALPHNLVSGDRILLQATSISAYNTWSKITYVNSTQFTLDDIPYTSVPLFSSAYFISGESITHKFLTIEGKQVIFPTETERYHIDGVKKSFKTSQEVVDYFTKEIKAQEQSQDLPEMTNQPVQMEFESKSYKSNRYKR